MGVMRDHSVLIACIGAGSAVLAAFAKPICDALSPEVPASPTIVAHAPVNPAPVTPTPITPTPNQPPLNIPPIEGAWKQYVLSETEGVVYLGTFVVGRSQGEYVISPRVQQNGAHSATHEYQPSLGIFEVVYDGQTWRFNSNWGQNENGEEEVGNFELRRVSPTIFEGEIRVAGELSNRTRMVKIE
jgi:hypothetical protein